MNTNINQISENIKISFLERQNQDLKKQLNLLRTKFFQTFKTKDKEEIKRLMTEILTILDLPIED